MKFEGEHLLPGQIGHFFIILAFVASLFSAFGFFKGNYTTDPIEKNNWLRFARTVFIAQVIAVFVIFAVLFFICSNHYFEYLYAYKHSSKELEPKFLLACIWEGQEGSFLLWTIWHSLLGIFLIFKAKDWEAPVMGIISLAQAFLFIMILGIYFFGVKIGNNPFALTRNEIAGPIFSRPDYLSFIKDGIGLNVLLRNYWMVIHPPVLFLGFASTIIPFAFAAGSLLNKRFSYWVRPALPYALFTACVLGVGIMMGGKWAYESLSFGGYWAWDPVENASLVPWMIMIAGLHTMVIYNATGHSLRASYIFAILSFVFILYSTYLTRTGVLGDTSVHAFTEESKVIKTMLQLLMAAFTLPSLFLFFKNYSQIPSEAREEKIHSREFWMFIGAVIFFLASLFIIAKTSVPVINKMFGTNWAPPEDVEYGYNKAMVLVIIIIAVLTAITQYFKYKTTPADYTLKKIALPTLLAAILTVLLIVFYPITYNRYGIGFLSAIYLALFGGIYSLVANAMYIWIGLQGKLKSAGGSIAHIGFAILLVGILISSGNKQIISDARANGITLPMAGKDPMSKKDDSPMENLTLIRKVPVRMGNYEVTYLKDSAGNEKNRRYYQILFERKDEISKNIIESFSLMPDVYQMKDNNMSSNPDTKNYMGKDVFTYISYTVNKDVPSDTTQFKVSEMAIGDTIFYSKGMIILDSVSSHPAHIDFNIAPGEKVLQASLTIIGKDSMRYHSRPSIVVTETSGRFVDDTLYAQNLYVNFTGVGQQKRIKIGIKESDKIIDFVTLKAYVFPYINLVWIGLIVMAGGILLSMVNRAKLSLSAALIVLIFAIAALSYMFLLAN
jgi:cytochrome c-type biogenesis protein CcmF